MIARPVHRPRPIPFDAPSPATGLSASLSTGAAQTRAVSWTSTLGPGAPAPANLHVVPRLSPVKVALSAAPTPLHAHHAHAPGQCGAQVARRPVHAVQAVQAATAGRAAGATPSHDVGGPRLNQGGKAANAMTEVSARYIGHGALSVRSSVTGRHYRFQGHGDSLVIDRNDVVLLKRISDLVIR